MSNEEVYQLCLQRNAGTISPEDAIRLNEARTENIENMITYTRSLSLEEREKLIINLNHYLNKHRNAGIIKRPKRNFTKAHLKRLTF